MSPRSRTARPQAVPSAARAPSAASGGNAFVIDVTAITIDGDHRRNDHL